MAASMATGGLEQAVNQSGVAAPAGLMRAIGFGGFAVGLGLIALLWLCRRHLARPPPAEGATPPAVAGA
jgi:tetrahydromethanopterin S-methyltransferase subunit B